MSEAKNQGERWKSEQLRAERKARLARMKAKDGGKKEIRTSNPAARLITILVLIAAILITGFWAVSRSGLLQRQLTAVTVGSVNIPAVDLNYYFFTQLSQYGIDPNDPQGQATLKAASGIEGFKTNADYLKDMAAQQLQRDVVLSEQAALAGTTLTEEDIALVDNYFDNLQNTAIQAGKTVENYLITTFGPGTTVETLRRVIDRLLLADRFANQKTESFTFTEAELQAGYEADKDAYDVIDYRVFYFAADIKSGATDAEKTKALEDAKKKADEMLGKITDGASFRELCITYAPEADQVKYRTEDFSLQTRKHNSDVAMTAQKTWLFDAARKSGDKTVVDSVSGYYVLYFEGRARADYQLANVRHILIQAARASATEEQITAARDKAEAVLAEYKSGDQTEDAFAELAKTNSADGNAAQGGLYERVYPGQMVREFEDWCFDSTRKAGDTGIVQTDFGFHVMYYSGDAGADWEIRVTATLRDEAFNTYLESELAKYPYSFKSPGYRYVG